VNPSGTTKTIYGRREVHHLRLHDELSKKLWRLLPEKRTIQSMILPPIRDGCVTNYHNKHISKTSPLVDQSLDVMDQLKYCRYLRPKPVKQNAWEDTGQAN